MQLRKRCGHRGQLAIGHQERGIGSGIFQMHAGQHLHAVLNAEQRRGRIDGNALLTEFGEARRGQFADHPAQLGNRFGSQGEL